MELRQTRAEFCETIATRPATGRARLAQHRSFLPSTPRLIDECDAIHVHLQGAIQKSLAVNGKKHIRLQSSQPVGAA
jgi:hypothetical protein